LPDESSLNRVLRELLSRNYSLTIHTNLVDAHFYIFSKAALAMLEARKEKIVSIKGELIPYLVRCQFRKAFTRTSASLARSLAMGFPNSASP
jgi:hypothetical protein